MCAPIRSLLFWHICDDFFKASHSIEINGVNNEKLCHLRASLKTFTLPYYTEPVVFLHCFVVFRSIFLHVSSINDFVSILFDLNLHKYAKGTISQSQLCKNLFNHGQVRSFMLPEMLYQNTQSDILWQCFIKKGVSV